MNNPHAFPCSESVVETGVYGMSLRDHFAAAALQGYLASWGSDADIVIDRMPQYAALMYAMADAMLREREK